MTGRRRWFDPAEIRAPIRYDGSGQGRSHAGRGTRTMDTAIQVQTERSDEAAFADRLAKLESQLDHVRKLDQRINFLEMELSRRVRLVEDASEICAEIVADSGDSSEQVIAKALRLYDAARSAFKQGHHIAFVDKEDFIVQEVAGFESEPNAKAERGR